MPHIWLALLLLWLCGPAWALQPALLESNDLRLSLGPSMGYLEDPDGSLSLEQVGRLPDDLAGYLEVNYPLLDHLQLYLAGPDGNWQTQESGDKYAFSQRPVQVRNFWFPVDLPPGSSTLLIRVETTSTVFVPLFFSTYHASAAAQENLMGINGAFYGVLFAMFCYNLFLFIS